MAIETPARIAIIGGGPLGLETGLYARYLGYDAPIFEQQDSVSLKLASEDARLPGPFREHRSTLGIAALAAQDPDAVLPDDNAVLTVREWLDAYIHPLSRTDLLADHLRPGTLVSAVEPRTAEPADDEEDKRESRSVFTVFAKEADGGETRDAFDGVIDTTGAPGAWKWLGPQETPLQGMHHGVIADAADVTPESLQTRVPNLYVLGGRLTGDAPQLSFTAGLRQIRTLFTLIGGRADLDLYESVRNLLP